MINIKVEIIHIGLFTYKIHIFLLAPTLVSDGWCLDANGDDQNNGSLSIPGSYEPNECFKKCLAVSHGTKVTGCESHEGGRCSYHTNPVSGGSGDTDTNCWILKGMHILLRKHIKIVDKPKDLSKFLRKWKYFYH